MGDLVIIVVCSWGVTGLLMVKSGSLEGPVPFLGGEGLLFVVTRVWRGPAVLCPASQWIMVFSLSPLLSLSLSVCP